MPSIEELLNEAESHMAAQPVNDVLEINPETREISIPDSEIILGVETDQKAERKYFHCPKIVGNNIDLSALELYVVFQNASNMEKGKDRYHVTDVKTTSDGYITFSWELSAKVTAYKGDVQFVVCAIKTDSSGVKQNVWNTTIAIGKCLIGLSSDMSESEEQSASDLYTQLISELNSTASAKLTEVTTQIQTVGNNQVSNVNNAGTTQVNNVQNKGTEVLASIPDTYTELDASVKQLNEQIRGKAPVITERATIQSGSHTTVTDSAEMQLQGLRLYGKSWQETTTGANLFDANDVSQGFISDDAGNNMVETDSYCSNFIAVSAKTKYYLHSDQDAGRWGAFYDSSKTFILGITTDKYNTVFETPENAAYIRFTVDYNNNNPNFARNVIFAKSTVALPFEPYTGGKPSPSPEYPQEIVSAGQKLSTGKNLINADDYYSEYKQTDGMYKVDDVKLNDITIIFDSSMVGKTYTASCNLNCPNTVSNVALEATIDGKKVLGNIIPTNKSGISKVTFTPKTARDSIKITYGSGRWDIIFSDFQIEAGSIATSYEPYTGGVPTLYQKDIEVRVTGKNLFGGKAFVDEIVEIGGSLDETNKTVTISASKLEGKNIYEFPDKTKQYTVMLSGHNLSSAQSANLRIVYEDNSHVDLVFVNGKLLFVTDKNKKPKKIYGIYCTSTTVFNYEQFGIFEGVLTETDFKEYEYQSLQIATPTGLPAIPVDTDGNYTDVNGQQWIADYIDLKRGKYVQRVWQKTFDGSSDEEWGEHWREGTYTTRIKWSDLVLPRKILCNQYIYGNGIGQFDSLLDNGQLHLYFNYDNGTIGMDAFKALIASNPIKVMTYLDTPIETDLTEAQIQAYKSLTTFKPTSIISNDAGAQMEVEYACDTKTWVTNKINTLIKEATTS